MSINQKNITRILRLPEVIHLTGQSKTTIYERIKAGTFPKQISLGNRCVGWNSNDITYWLDSIISTNNYDSANRRQK